MIKQFQLIDQISINILKVITITKIDEACLHGTRSICSMSIFLRLYPIFRGAIIEQILVLSSKITKLCTK